jgi:hypothetical protein
LQVVEQSSLLSIFRSQIQLECLLLKNNRHEKNKRNEKNKNESSSRGEQQRQRRAEKSSRGGN